VTEVIPLHGMLKFHIEWCFKWVSDVEHATHVTDMAGDFWKCSGYWYSVPTLTG